MGDWTGGECAVRNLGSQSLQDSLGHNSPYALLKTPSRNSDVDFSDVFGGPPKRSSAQEFSHSERDSFDSHSLDDNDNLGDEESTWVKFREKPVFGEALGVRRRYTTDDFFDDIFRGDQPSSSSQSPRVGSRRNPFASAPGSRVMSPSRSLPTPELFATPAKFSLPSRLTNTDFTASTSSNQNSFNPPLSRFNQTIPNPDVSNQVSPQSSAFPRQNSTDIKESTCDSQLGGIADQSHIHSDVKVSELPIYASDFHFSIYKWASKGVPLVISLRKKSSRSNQATRLDKVHEDVSSYGLEDVIETQNPAVVHEHSDPPKSLPKKTKFSVKPLSSFLKEEDKVNIEKGRVEEKENLSSAKKDSRHKVDKTATKKDGRKSEASSKVKDFVKIFNQDSPSKTSGPQLRQSESRRWKDTKTVEVDYEIRFSSARMSEETEATYVNWGEELEDENPLGSQPININDIGFVPDTTDAQTTSTAPNVDTQRDSAPNTNVDSPRDSAPKTNEASDDNVLAKEEIKGCETKVSLWAKGKEGNIRALLSTLQMVLWPDSGWKPVPLVDIIEASAVKRAYQKALLRLHPDKLQQKGASLHHKLIAEKVFDILQEAWDQFNSLGSV